MSVTREDAENLCDIVLADAGRRQYVIGLIATALAQAEQDGRDELAARCANAEAEVGRLGAVAKAKIDARGARIEKLRDALDEVRRQLYAPPGGVLHEMNIATNGLVDELRAACVEALAADDRAAPRVRAVNWATPSREDVLLNRAQDMLDAFHRHINRAVVKAVRAGYRGPLFVWTEWHGTHGVFVAHTEPPKPGEHLSGAYAVDLTDEDACARLLLEVDAAEEMEAAEAALHPGA